MDYTAVRKTGAQTLHTALGPVWKFDWEKSCIFSLRKNQLFFCVENNVFFCVEKSGIFVGRPVLDSGQRTADSGQTGCPVVDNGTLGGSSCTGHGGWTVDGTEWTEVLSLL